LECGAFNAASFLGSGEEEKKAVMNHRTPKGAPAARRIGLGKLGKPWLECGVIPQPKGLGHARLPL
jgi:hypothetical protein